MNWNGIGKISIAWSVLWIACIVMTATGHSAEITATRSYDLDYTSGQTVSVTLDITIPGDMTLSSIIVKEILPEGWTFVSSQPVASATTSDTREYKWLVYGHSIGSQQIQYTVTAQGLDAFEGEVIYADSNDDVHKIPIETAFPSYRIDSILPMTGALSDYGVKIKNGIELAVADHNDNRSINRSVFISNSYDNQSATDSIDALVQNANNDDTVLALVGGAASQNVLYLASLCESFEIPMFVPTATATQLTDENFTAKVVPSDRYQVDAVYQLLLQQSGDTTDYAIVAENSEYGLGFLELENKQGNAVCAGNYVFPAHALDASEAVQFLTNLLSTVSLDAVVMAVYEDDAVALLKAIQDSESASLKETTLLFTDSAITPTTIDIGPERQFTQTVYGVRPIIPETSAAIAFANEYKAAYETEPEWFSYYAYDSVRAFEEAFKKATVKTRRDIWNAVPWLHFDGVTGSKTFDEKGNLYSAAYDFFYVNDSAWTKFDTVNIFQPEISLEHGLWKVASRIQQTSNPSTDFTYSLKAADPPIRHLAGERAHDTGWMAESLDAPMGGVLMAYYEDIERGLSTEGNKFVFEDGRTYYLTFNALRVDRTEGASAEGDVLDISVTSVYRYQNGDGVTHFARRELLDTTVALADWPSDTSKQITLPVAYITAAPDASNVTNEDNRFHWELKLLNAANQKVLLTSVEIGTGVPTAVEDYMLH